MRKQINNHEIMENLPCAKAQIIKTKMPLTYMTVILHKLA